MYHILLNQLLTVISKIKLLEDDWKSYFSTDLAAEKIYVNVSVLEVTIFIPIDTKFGIYVGKAISEVQYEDPIGTPKS